MALASSKPVNPKGLASLSPTLLARKGGAKPAMRPHTMPIPVGLDLSEIDHDLGWNDLGGDHGHEAEVVSIHRASESGARRQQERLSREFASQPAPVRQSALALGRKAAFTLRLDEERHLRLRLACTASNLSAQAIVIQALDQFLELHPELNAIAGELRRKRK